ncbi:single-stranded DNA-binding protein [Nocardioides jishulii]|uniref:Single-stranded DNA-binding protein n=1 Tax=Nocardioides jishulii TaxID=2575440 RepID=A0A4U2YR72_9ACTN|nr:single-stranded DNA-binding protein [Nocardioides jishulii]QCX27664.1 single-stranded DNA-binding protein [Nocardioides jishulii]TKI62471.1 single-stranded DNA-binding protein [Nocardioides jishulii]
MTIPTQMSLPGFIATTPELTHTQTGTERFYARVGVEHYRKEADGTYTQLETSFHSLVAFSKTALHAYEQFRVGDSVVASGYINEYEVERHGHVEMREEFVARRLGHDTARTRYEVDRSPRTEPEAPGVEVPQQQPRVAPAATAASPSASSVPTAHGMGI